LEEENDEDSEASEFVPEEKDWPEINALPFLKKKE